MGSMAGSTSAAGSRNPAHFVVVVVLVFVVIVVVLVIVFVFVLPLIVVGIANALCTRPAGQPQADMRG
jgi:hypothetical protein